METVHRIGHFYGWNTPMQKSEIIFGKFPPPYIIFAVLTPISMNINGIETYQSPQIVTVETLYEGVVCSSNEMLEENEGEW